MASNGPYYQSVPPDQPASDDYKLTPAMLEFNTLPPQPSLYPEPTQAQMTSEYHGQHLADNDPEDTQLQNLVEAATSAAAQEQIRQRSRLEPFAQSEEAQQPDSAEQHLISVLTDAAKRKRSLPPDGHVADPALSASTPMSDRPKRQKRPTLSTVEDRSIRQYHNPAESPHHLDARAAGVHSAAALFRPPSDSSKKYTRPPMSKLFSSLELSPENFLYLQAAAKQFMLDPDHPERQACVGNRGKGDSDMVKLRLHHCVREFLERDGWGEKYFGVNAPGPDPDGDNAAYQRKFVWPQDETRIVALCTPLLRRMVTNERQRQYAVESRSKTGAKQDRPHDTDPDQEIDANADNHSAEPSQNAYDPRLAQGPAHHLYMLNKDSKDLLNDRVDYPLHDGFSWDILTQEVQRLWCEVIQVEQPPPDLAATFFETFTVKVLTSGGLTTVSNEGEWQLACQDARQAVWLEGDIKVVVDCVV
ncbi:hypothetical protein BDV97DRAFT_116865 [Delphinella strobiligena]|nr:hypothetical protein BDV97DRAFT_116865 [Delphinella strobiligena]